MASDPLDSITLTKIEAAHRQIETALNLWFHEGDPVSIHTLAAAAHRVVHDVAEYHGLDGAMLTDSNRLFQWGYDPKDFKKRVRKSETFFKHALNDPEDVHLFDHEFTPLILWSTIECYKRLESTKHPLMSLFMAWMGFHNPSTLTKEARNRFSGLIPIINTLSRREFFEAFSEFDFGGF
jgi:hypothetical protein